MIVADVNLLIYLLVPGPFTADAERAWVRDPTWIAPPVHRYELLNIMATNVRSGAFGIDEAILIIDRVGRMVQEVADPDRKMVLQQSVDSRIGTYDCEYVVVARSLGIRVVTADRKMQTMFSDVTVSIQDFAAGN